MRIYTLLIRLFIVVTTAKGTINNGFYNDRYFPGLLDYIKKNTDSDVYYLPTLLINKDFLPSFIKVVKQNNFLAKEPYLKPIRLA